MLSINDIEIDEEAIKRKKIAQLQQQIGSVRASQMFSPKARAAIGLGSVAQHYFGSTLGGMPLIAGALLGYKLAQGDVVSPIAMQVAGNKIAQLQGMLKSLTGEIGAMQSAHTGIMNSEQLINYQYKTLPFTGKFYDLIGEPSHNAHIVVYGLPKNGKSIFSTQLAKYLSQNFGKVLYVSAEEGFSVTLQKKARDFAEGNANFDFANFRRFEEIQEAMRERPYMAVVIDSVNFAKITAEQVEQLKAENPNTMFITIHQATKQGQARGSQEYIHNADTIIRVHEGIATSMGRFNEGGEYIVFEKKKEVAGSAVQGSEEAPVTALGQYQMELSDYSGGMDY
jgi:hypothetical protein